MPKRLSKPCAYPGCPRLTHGRYCEQHAKQEAVRIDKARGTAAERGYDARWQRARARYLAEHPLCDECYKRGLVVAATVVDHIIPHKGDLKLFWDERNWQPLCKRCHDRKTAMEDGRWKTGDGRRAMGLIV